jgi:hypothetical protein
MNIAKQRDFLLQEINIVESKIVGDLYHITETNNLLSMLNTNYMVPNNERAVSTTRDYQFNLNKMRKEDSNESLSRITFDGNKLSNKYKIKPFNWTFSTKGNDFYDDDDLDKIHKNVGVKDETSEEQIIINGKYFFWLPYVKRIDIYINKKIPKNLKKIEEKLKILNITYDIIYSTSYKTPRFTSNKEGESKNYPPPNKVYSDLELKFHLPNTEIYNIGHIVYGESPTFPKHYYIPHKNNFKSEFDEKNPQIIDNPYYSWTKEPQFQNKIANTKLNILFNNSQKHDYPYLFLYNKKFIDDMGLFKTKVKI